MKCKHEPCNNDAKGNGKYCSPTCKTLFNRNKGKVKRIVTPTVTDDRNTGDNDSAVVSLEHYQLNPTMYAQRTNPTLINWDAPMSMAELNKAGLKGNRTAIPGDHDYVGCWQRQGTPPKPHQGVNAV